MVYDAFDDYNELKSDLISPSIRLKKHMMVRFARLGVTILNDDVHLDDRFSHCGGGNWVLLSPKCLLS